MYHKVPGLSVLVPPSYEVASSAHLESFLRLPQPSSSTGSNSSSTVNPAPKENLHLHSYYSGGNDVETALEAPVTVESFESEMKSKFTEIENRFLEDHEKNKERLKLTHEGVNIDFKTQPRHPFEEIDKISIETQDGIAGIVGKMPYKEYISRPLGMPSMTVVSRGKWMYEITTGNVTAFSVGWIIDPHLGDEASYIRLDSATRTIRAGSASLGPLSSTTYFVRDDVIGIYINIENSCYKWSLNGIMIMEINFKPPTTSVEKHQFMPSILLGEGQITNTNFGQLSMLTSVPDYRPLWTIEQNLKLVEQVKFSLNILGDLLPHYAPYSEVSKNQDKATASSSSVKSGRRLYRQTGGCKTLAVLNVPVVPLNHQDVVSLALLQIKTVHKLLNTHWKPPFKTADGTEMNFILTPVSRAAMGALVPFVISLYKQDLVDQPFRLRALVQLIRDAFPDDWPRFLRSIGEYLVCQKMLRPPRPKILNFINVVLAETGNTFDPLYTLIALFKFPDFTTAWHTGPLELLLAVLFYVPIPDGFSRLAPYFTAESMEFILHNAIDSAGYGIHFENYSNYCSEWQEVSGNLAHALASWKYNEEALHFQRAYSSKRNFQAVFHFCDWVKMEVNGFLPELKSQDPPRQSFWIGFLFQLCVFALNKSKRTTTAIDNLEIGGMLARQRLNFLKIDRLGGTWSYVNATFPNPNGNRQASATTGTNTNNITTNNNTTNINMTGPAESSDSSNSNISQSVGDPSSSSSPPLASSSSTHGSQSRLESNDPPTDHSSSNDTESQPTPVIDTPSNESASLDNINDSEPTPVASVPSSQVGQEAVAGSSSSTSSNTNDPSSSSSTGVENVEPEAELGPIPPLETVTTLEEHVETVTSLEEHIETKDLPIETVALRQQKALIAWLESCKTDPESWELRLLNLCTFLFSRSVASNLRAAGILFNDLELHRTHLENATAARTSLTKLNFKPGLHVDLLERISLVEIPRLSCRVFIQNLEWASPRHIQLILNYAKHLSHFIKRLSNAPSPTCTWTAYIPEMFVYTLLDIIRLVNQQILGTGGLEFTSKSLKITKTEMESVHHIWEALFSLLQNNQILNPNIRGDIIKKAADKLFRSVVTKIWIFPAETFHMFLKASFKTISEDALEYWSDTVGALARILSGPSDEDTLNYMKLITTFLNDPAHFAVIDTTLNKLFNTIAVFANELETTLDNYLGALSRYTANLEPVCGHVSSRSSQIGFQTWQDIPSHWPTLKLSSGNSVVSLPYDGPSRVQLLEAMEEHETSIEEAIQNFLPLYKGLSTLILLATRLFAKSPGICNRTISLMRLCELIEHIFPRAMDPQTASPFIKARRLLDIQYSPGTIINSTDYGVDFYHFTGHMLLYPFGDTLAELLADESIRSKFVAAMSGKLSDQVVDIFLSYRNGSLNDEKNKILETYLPDIKQKDERANLLRSQDEECPICFTNPINTTFLPCKHRSCSICIHRHRMNDQRCFFCNGVIQSLVDDRAPAREALDPLAQS